MKIAGRRNDGAWFRTNKAIAALSDENRASLISAMKESLGAKAGAFVADVQALAAECGVTNPTTAQSADTLLERFGTVGIPRQVWWGKLSFTTYSPIGVKVEGVPQKFQANYQSAIHYFAKDLRRFMKYWVLGLRQLNDITDLTDRQEGNPGGLPDTHPEG